MDNFKIKYGTGEMVLVVDGFFPCTIQKSRIIFPLIREWCSEEEKAELRKELVELRDGYKELERMCEGRDERKWKAMYKRMVTMRKRMDRNIKELDRQ